MLEAGAVHDRTTLPSPAVTCSDRGAVGNPYGVAFVTVDAVPAPAEMRAETRNPYDTPFERPGTVYDVRLEPVLAMTVVYVVSGFTTRSTR